MKLEMLISAVNANPIPLIKGMKPECDSVLINQCDTDGDEELRYGNFSIKVFFRKERGVGRSRNLALANANADVLLFSDEDICYRKGYAKAVLEEFQEHPEADILLFNVNVCKERQTYWNDSFHRVKWYNCGRYPAYSIAIRKDKLQSVGVKYSELFGGGAKYSNGEDSLFLKQCADKGLKLYASTVIIGEEIPRESTWFHGYTEKFFFDRGVLFAYLYGKMAKVWAIRFVLTKKEMLQGEIKGKQAYRLLCDGIRQGRIEQKG